MFGRRPTTLSTIPGTLRTPPPHPKMRRAGYAANTPARSRLSLSRTTRCAPRARLGVRAIRWAIRQLRFEGATTCGLARQLGTTWNTVWSHIKPCLQAASDDPARFAGVRVLGVDEHVWHHQDRHRRGPRELTGIVDLTRGEDHPTARLLDLVPGRSGTVYKNWLEERGEDFRAGVQIATLDPFQGQQERHR